MSANAHPLPSTTSFATIDGSLRRLHIQKTEWATATAGELLSLVEEVRGDLAQVGRRWVSVSIAEKGLSAGTLGEAEEWIFFSSLLRSLRMLAVTLREQSNGEEYSVRLIPGEPTRVFPRDKWDRLLFPGLTGDVLRSSESTERQARQPGTGQVVLVLGAGNASPLAPVDVLHKLFVERKCVILKPNPVNAYLGPLIEEGFAALIRRGCLAIAYGDNEQGEYLTEHELVAELHLTGSHRTYEAIMFGTGPEGESRRAQHAPVNHRPFSAELGNVSPIIVVPGRWSRKDINHQAVQVATWLTANAGFGCLTPRVLILQREWSQRKVFIARLEQVLARTATRRAYYPGAERLHREFVTVHPGAIQLGTPAPCELPWTLIKDVDSTRGDDPCFRKEAFCGLMSVTSIDAPTVPAFIDRAVAFANSTLWGTLCATLLVHPASCQEPPVGAAVERAIADLRYGTVTVNAFAYLSYYLGVLPWGAYPGHEPWDIQSGTGKVANMMMIEGAEKSILRAPFRRVPDDPIRVTSRRPDRFASRMAEFEAAPSVTRLPGLLLTGLTG